MKLSALLQPLIDAKVPHEIIMQQILAFEAQQDSLGSSSELRKQNERARAKRWRKRLNLNPSDWQAIKGEVLRRDNYTCSYCGRTGVPMHVDHVIPLIQGGGNDLGNLVAACAECNCGKSGRTPEQWAR